MADTYKSLFLAVVLGYCCFVVYAEVSSEEESTLSATPLENYETSTVPSEYVTKQYSIHGQSLEICSDTTLLCGFQLYDEDGEKSSPLIHYCECPEDGYCVKVYRNLNPLVLQYRCKEILEAGDETIEMSFQTTEPVIPDNLYGDVTEDGFYASIEALHETKTRREEMESERQAVETISFAISETIDNMQTQSVFEDGKSSGPTTDLDIGEVQTTDDLVAETAFGTSRGYIVKENDNTYVSSSEFEETYNPEFSDTSAKFRSDDQDKDEL